MRAAQKCDKNYTVFSLGTPILKLAMVKSQIVKKIVEKFLKKFVKSSKISSKKFVKKFVKRSVKKMGNSIGTKNNSDTKELRCGKKTDTNLGS